MFTGWCSIILELGCLFKLRVESTQVCKIQSIFLPSISLTNTNPPGLQRKVPACPLVKGSLFALENRPAKSCLSALKQTFQSVEDGIKECGDTEAVFGVENQESYQYDPSNDDKLPE